MKIRIVSMPIDTESILWKLLKKEYAIWKIKKDIEEITISLLYVIFFVIDHKSVEKKANSRKVYRIIWNFRKVFGKS